MLGFAAVGSYVLVVAIAALLVAILVWQPFRDKRTVNVWLASSVGGALLGSALTYAVMRPDGDSLAKAAEPSPPEAQATAPESDCPMRAKMMAMAGALGMPGVGGPKRELATLVQKLDILTGDIAVTLTAEQAAAINDCLKDVENSPKMSDDEAKAKRRQMITVLTENQLDRLDAIAVPPSACGGIPGKTCPMTGGPMMPGMGSEAAPKQDENSNPFQGNAEGEAVRSLRDRLASKKTGPKAETPESSTPKAPPAKAETPRAL